jgi:phosphoglycolate phosphatase-like HAD superfamily hydrolase
MATGCPWGWLIGGWYSLPWGSIKELVGYCLADDVGYLPCLLANFPLGWALMVGAIGLPGTSVEILNPAVPIGRIRHAIFDFDGTISLVREGWQDVMVPMMLEYLTAAAPEEDPESIALTVRDFVTRLTGKQTIYQMIELADQIKRRGGSPLEPLEYKHEYLRRLEVRIADRVEGLETKRIDASSLLVPGSIELLESLRDRGIRMYLASGTDEPFVLREAKLLGVDHFFDGGIFGALDNYQNFSKKMVIDRIIRENSLHGPELVAFGDGYVEIENTKSVGGIAVGMPTFESDPVRWDEWKKERLKQAGADVLIPNFVDHRPLLSFLFGDE